MKVTCPSCQRVVPAADVNVQSHIARCALCNEVFDFSKQLGLPDAPAAETMEKAPVLMPKGFTLSRQLSDLVITRTWFSAQYLGLLFFCIFWDGFLVVWYTIVFSQGAPLPFMLFPLLHVAAGVFITYTALAGLFNRTEIRISNRYLSVRHFPLPWPGAKSIDASQVEQLFCEEVYKQRRNGSSTTYTVRAVLQGGERVELVSNLEQPNHARFIEQEVEERLGIADRRVAGEMPAV